MKIYIYLIISFILLASINNDFAGNHQKTIKLDTISATFLYEVNVPEMCYQRFDQIDQGNNLILYNKNIKRVNIDSLYNNGIYYFSNDKFTHNLEVQNGINVYQNKSSIYNFLNSIDYSHHRNSKYRKTLIRDKSGILLYKKVYAKFVVAFLGQQMQLTPQTNNYKCCYSNNTESINAYLIVDVINYKIY